MRNHQEQIAQGIDILQDCDTLEWYFQTYVRGHIIDGKRGYAQVCTNAYETRDAAIAALRSNTIEWL